jgi:hypothetical protein
VLWSGIEIIAEGSNMMQTGLLDWQIRFRQLDAGGDPLPKLEKLVDWERFRPDLEAVRDKERKSNAGRKPFDVLLLFKVLVLQSLYTLSDERIEFQIRVEHVFGVQAMQAGNLIIRTIGLILAKVKIGLWNRKMKGDNFHQRSPTPEYI